MLENHYLAIGGAIGLAFLIDMYPKLGGALLILIVLGMVLTASRKGLI